MSSENILSMGYITFNIHIVYVVVVAVAAKRLHLLEEVDNIPMPINHTTTHYKLHAGIKYVYILSYERNIAYKSIAIYI